ncbi:MAG TPA: SRPBCC domain-containing protein [Candidatus Limnocylindrales bacterium]|nr:SRPBCC domain-containing protein [Candidatus Limnocylindrales bacterium]
MSGPRFHAARRIAATPDRVWALLVDLPSWRSWNPTVVSVEGDVAPGGTVRLVATVNERRTFVLRVMELVPPRRMVWASGMPLGLFRGTRTYTLAPAADDTGTDFAMTEAYTGVLAGLIGRSIPDLGPSFEAFADGLKAAAERG